MIAVLQQIVDVIQVIFTSVINFLVSVAMLFSRLPEFLAFMTTSVAALPSVIVPFLLFGFTLSILLLILGRHS